MYCLRHRGRRAVLLKLMPLEDAKRPEKPEKPEGEAKREKPAAEKPAEKPVEKPKPEPKPEPKPGDEARLYGRIAELSREAVTVRGEAGSLTCRLPAGYAEKVAGRFAVGDAVKLMCRGSELTYLEKTP
jgi:hypothetical protein